jgi:hypothetical protein
VELAPPRLPTPAEVAAGRAGDRPAVDATPPPADRTPVWRRWWLWTAVGVAIAGTATTIFIVTRGDDPLPELGRFPFDEF